MVFISSPSGRCAKDYHLQDGMCKECHGSKSMLIVVVIIFVVVVFGIGIYFGRYRQWLIDKFPAYLLIFDMGKFKILWSVLQIISSVDWTLSIRFPEPFASVQHYISLVTQLSLSNLLPMNCFMQYSFQEHLLFSCLAPIALAIALGVGLALKLGLSYAREKKSKVGIAGKSDHTTRKLESQRRSMIDSTTWTFLFLTFIILPSTSAAIFRTFQCQEFPSGESYLAADLSIACESHRYRGCRLFAFFMVAICKRLEEPCSIFVTKLDFTIECCAHRSCRRASWVPGLSWNTRLPH